MVPLALAADTISILFMEVVGNAITLAIPGAMDAGLSDLRFRRGYALVHSPRGLSPRSRQGVGPVLAAHDPPAA